MSIQSLSGPVDVDVVVQRVCLGWLGWDFAGSTPQQQVVEEEEIKMNPDKHLRLIWVCVAWSVDPKKESQI